MDNTSLRNPPPLYEFLLFVSGDCPTGHKAQEDVAAMCAQHLGDRCAVRIINVLGHMDEAVAHRVFATPTLVLTAPHSARVLGDFRNALAVLGALGLQPL